MFAACEEAKYWWCSIWYSERAVGHTSAVVKEMNAAAFTLLTHPSAASSSSSSSVILSPKTFLNPIPPSLLFGSQWRTRKRRKMARAKAKAMAALGLSTWRVRVLFPYATSSRRTVKSFPWLRCSSGMGRHEPMQKGSDIHASSTLGTDLDAPMRRRRCYAFQYLMFFRFMITVSSMRVAHGFHVFYTVQIHKKYEYESDQCTNWRKLHLLYICN